MAPKFDLINPTKGWKETTLSNSKATAGSAN